MLITGVKINQNKRGALGALGLAFSHSSSWYLFRPLVLRQYIERSRAHQMACTAGLFLSPLGALIENYSEFSLSWGSLIYCFYYVVAATLAGFLGLGKVYLIFRKKNFSHLFLAYLLVVPVLFLYLAFTVPLKLENLVFEMAFGGKAVPDSVRLFSFFYTMPGTVFLLAGAVYLVAHFAAKKEHAYLNVGQCFNCHMDIKNCFCWQPGPNRENRWPLSSGGAGSKFFC